MAIPAKKAEPTLLAEARHMVQVFAKASKIALAQIYYLIFCIYNKTQQIIVKYSETYLKKCVYSQPLEGEGCESGGGGLPTDVIVSKIQDHVTLNRHSTCHSCILRVCFKVDYTRQCWAKIVVFSVVAIVGKPLMSHFLKFQR